MIIGLVSVWAGMRGRALGFPWRQLGLCVIIGALVALGLAHPLHASEPVTSKPGPEGEIVLSVTEVRTDQGGTLVAILYRGQDGWMDPDSAYARREVTASSDSIDIVFSKVPFDSTYAAQILHDKNGNGKLDFRKFPFPKPKEGVGVSNNTFRMGPPDYRKARFSVNDRETRLVIRMRY